ncbi:hypothetical protein GQ457_08G027960 [Hibiscus cannabinus]
MEDRRAKYFEKDVLIFYHQKSVERNIYLFDIERVKIKKRMNVIHVQDQKHELTPPRNRYPCDNGYKEVTAFPPRDIVYDQDIKLIVLRDKPITQQDALSRSESPPRFLPGQDPLSLFEASPLSSCLVHPNKQESKIQKLLPEKMKKSRNPFFPGAREVGAQGEDQTLGIYMSSFGPKFNLIPN